MIDNAVASLALDVGSLLARYPDLDVEYHIMDKFTSCLVITDRTEQALGSVEGMENS